MRGIKRERIIRILLIEKQITKYRLAKLAKCSFPWVHEFLKLLEKKKLVKITKVINKEEHEKDGYNYTFLDLEK